MKFRASINPHGQVYLPSEIRAELGSKQLEILGDTRAVVLYPGGTEPSEVLRSLRIVMADLKHRSELIRREPGRQVER